MGLGAHVSCDCIYNNNNNYYTKLYSGEALVTSGPWQGVLKIKNLPLEKKRFTNLVA